MSTPQDILRPTPFQEAQILQSAFDAAGAGYAEQVCIRFRNRPNEAAMLAAWQNLTLRHPILRSAFVHAGLSQPQMIVYPNPPFLWDAHDNADDAALAVLAAKSLKQPFNIAEPPLQRFDWVRMADGTAALVWSFHHLIMDGWSLGLILREVAELYRAGIRHEPPSLPDPVAFRHFVTWLSKRDQAAALAFWRDRLADSPARTPLAGVGGTARARHADRHVPSAHALEENCRREGVTIASACRLSWALALAEPGGLQDVVFGMLTALRPPDLPGADQIIGPMLTSFAARTRFCPADTLASALRRTQREALAEQPYTHAPLAGVLQESKLQPVQSVLVVETYPIDHSAVESSGLEIASITSDERAGVPLVVSITPGDGVSIRLSTPDGGVSAAALDFYADRCVHWLHCLSADLSRSLTDVLGASETTAHQKHAAALRSEIVVGENLTQAIFSKGFCIRAPGADMDAETLLTEAHRSARRAAALPLGAVVAIRSSGAMAIAEMFGCLRVGRSYMLAPATDPRSDDRVAFAGAVDFGAAEADMPPEWPPTEKEAYLLYTSGSEGTPKAVRQTQSAILGHALAFARSIGLGPTDTLCSTAALEFDASVMDVFACAITGATLVLANVAETGIAGIAETELAQSTLLHTTPTLFRLLAQRSLPPTLRVVVLGGEAASPPDLEVFRTHAPQGCRLINGFGPSECTTALQWVANDEPRVGRLPIGFPVEGTEVFLQAPDGQPRTAVWDTGEIIIQSARIATGYLGAPNDAFEQIGCDRTYRTGDLARRRPSGALEHIGRKDAQVKIGGVRIDPSEVEAAFMSIPGVETAHVLVEGSGEETRLCAWVCPQALDADSLRRILRQRLPLAFVPASIVVLPILPFLANGKVDRSALLAPRVVKDQSKPAEGRGEGIQAEILAAFRTLLKKDVGPTDDFFQMGGHSLDALRAASRLETTLERPIPIRLIFDNPTAQMLARALETAAKPERPRDPIPKRPRTWRRYALASEIGDRSGQPQLSLSFFAGSAEDPSAGYDLVLEAAKKADAMGLHAVWTPERHFNGFGGLYPSPEVLSAALATVTRQIGLRAGSVVLPLCDPLRVAEAWAQIDQLSGGRAGIALASGWHRVDFSALAPGSYERRRDILFEKLAVLKRLLAGDEIEIGDPESAEGRRLIRTYPHPLQARFPLWLTCQSESSFSAAAKRGLNVLTNLNYKSLDALGALITRFRTEMHRSDQRVTAMVHCCVGENDDAVRLAAAQAHDAYVRSNLVLQREHATRSDTNLAPSAADVDDLVRNATDRVLDGGAVIGGPRRAAERIRRLADAGVDEIACLVDFGLSKDAVLTTIDHLAGLASAACPSGTQPKDAFALLPAAPLQQQLWLLDSLTSDRSTWVIPTLVRIDGELDPNWLQARLNVLSNRHEALRTGLVERDGVVMQRILQSAPLLLGLEEAPTVEAAERMAQDIVDAGFALDAPPLARAVLYRIDDRTHVLLAAYHHAIADGFSTALLAREMFNGAPEQPACQLADWAAYQAGQEGARARDRAWWRDQLAPLPLRLRIGDGDPSYRLGIHLLPLDILAQEVLRTSAAEAKSTVFVGAVSAFAAALTEISGQAEFILGIHDANRAHPEAQTLVGPLVNVLPLRIAPETDLKALCRDALDHAELPYADIVRSCADLPTTGAGARTIGRNDPLIDAAVLHQNLEQLYTAGDLLVTRLPLAPRSVRFPLTLVLRETTGGIEASLAFDVGRFSAAWIARFSDCLLRHLTGRSAPGQVAVLPASPPIYAPGPHLLAAFLDDVERDSEALAVVDGDGRLSRRALRDRARRLAYALRNAYPAGSRIGVLVPPGCDMIVAVYGVLMADCTLVPLDPKDPPERREALLAAAEAACVVTPWEIELPVPRLRPKQSGPMRNQTPTGAHPAYIIFTSGSTGVPKGVVVGHDSVRALIGWARKNFTLEELSAVLLTAPICFDMSVFGLYVPLAGPGAIIVVRDVLSLVDGPPPHPVSLLYTVPSALRSLLADGVRLPSGLRCVNLGGEALDPTLLSRLLALVPRVCDMYGPTESTSNAFFESHITAGEITIGRPIAGTGAWIRRDDGSAAQWGEEGELVLTGAGLARGYLPPASNAPFSAEGYRTGDRALMTSDGRFRYFGRRDAQVKVRGFRLELSEIESQLAELAEVEAVAVRVHEDRLEAFIMPSGTCSKMELMREVVQLEAGARVRLPGFAVPSIWVKVPSLPLTANGKLDRRALAALDLPPQPTQTAGGSADQIAQVWEEVLGAPVASHSTSFFTLGGHSLLAIRLRRRLIERLGVDVPLAVIFEKPTVAEMALHLASAEPIAQHLTVLSADPANVHAPFPLTRLQQAYWVGSRDDIALGSVASQAYLELDTKLSIESLQEAVQTLVDRHQMLRMVIGDDGQQRILADPGPFRVDVEDLRGCPNVQEHLLARRVERSHHRADLSDWPLLRVWASRTEEVTRIHVSLPAIVLDAHSCYLIARELDDLLRGRALPFLDLTFRDVVVQGLNCPDEDGPLLLSAVPDGPVLPLSTSAKSDRPPRFRRLSLVLPTARWAAVKSAAADQGMTPAGVLMTALAWTLSGWTDQPDFSIVVTYFDRPLVHPDIDRVVGDFTSARVCPIQVGGSFAETAENVQRQLWKAISSTAYDAVRVVRAARQNGENRQFGVVFTSTLGLEPGTSSETGKIVYALTQTPQVVLDVKVREEEGALVCTWDLLEDLFPAGLPEDMQEVFARVLDGLSGPDGWAGAHAPLPASQELCGSALRQAPVLVERLHALHSPLLRGSRDDVVLIVGSEQFTRQQIAAAAEHVRRCIVKLDLPAEEVIALPAATGWQQIAGSLGIMAAGAAWMPIDPAWPSARIKTIAETAGARFALATECHVLSGFSTLTTLDAVHLQGEITLPSDDTALDRLAYVIFTSGSTGVPKGVEITHGGAANTIADLIARFDLRAPRIFGPSQLTFDLSVFDIFGALASGGRCLHPAPEAARDAKAWIAMLKEQRATVWNSAPALAVMLTETLEAADAYLPDLELAFLSGDWIPLDLPARLQDRAPRCRVISLGGATEASIWSIFHPIEKIDPELTSIPYGRALGGQGIHVLDHRRAPRPHWAVGEIHISGAGVARGYRNSPLQSDARFWEHPETGQKVYATGDLGRVHPDGWVEFLGRRDDQFKVLGHRVELGEIQLAALAYPGVRKAYAFAPRSASGQRRIVLNVEGNVTPEALRAHLADRLVASHIPREINVHDDIPLTENGKVDYKQLAIRAKPEVSASARPLAGSMALAIRSSFAGVLGKDDAPLDADFFAMGGDSVLAVRLLNRLQEEFSVTLPIQDLFADPTPRGLVRMIEDAAEHKAPIPDAALRASFDHRIRAAAKSRRGRRDDLGPVLFPLPKVPEPLLRKTSRQFSPFPIAAERLAGLLRHLRTASDGRRAYPSASGAYGVQIYILARKDRVSDLSGAWWLDADGGVLRQVSDWGWSTAMCGEGPNSEIARQAAFAIVFVADLKTLGPLYGSDALRLATLEAGYMAQIVSYASDGEGLGTCSIGSANDAAIDAALLLGPNRRVVHLMLGGTPLRNLIAQDAKWTPSAAPNHLSAKPRDEILLTGGGGLLGGALVRELTQRGRRVHCLLRDDADARVREMAKRLGISAELIVPLSGSLTDLENIRLDPGIGTLVHAAADVSFGKRYGELRESNVLGSTSVLDLCWRCDLTLHHISSISVFRERGRLLVSEQEPLPSMPPEDGGYAQSKWASEALGHAFRTAGGRAHIHRLAMIVSSAPSPTDYVALLVQMCKAVGAWPEVDVTLPLVRLDTAACAIAASIGQAPRVWHLQEPPKPSVRDLAAYIGGLTPVRAEDWMDRVMAAVHASDDHPLLPYLGIMRASLHDGALNPNGPTGSHLGSEESWQALATLGVLPAQSAEDLLLVFG